MTLKDLKQHHILKIAETHCNIVTVTIRPIQKVIIKS